MPPGAMSPRKTSPIVWVLVAILGLFVIAGLGIMGVAGLIVHRARQEGVSFDRRPGGGISITARDRDGRDSRVEIGSGSSADVPSWVPRYPGSNPVFKLYAAKDGEKQAGNFTFTTADSHDEVASFYREKCKGMKLDLGESAPGTDVLVFNDEDGPRRTLTVLISGSGRTTVNLTFVEK